MSTALRSAVPASLSTTRLTGLALLLGAHLSRGMRTASSLYVGAAALTTLVAGLLLSIATTSDPLWWQLHFSQLGTFGDLSSAFFNTTLKVSGTIVVFFAFCVRRDVRRLGRGPVRRGAATVAFVCLNVVGVNLALVGCIPLNTDKDLHDRVAGSMVLGFLALLITAPIMFNRLGKRMAVGTGIATVWLIVSIALFVTATINLALFETIACAAMFAWSGMFTQVLAGGAARASTTATHAPARHLAPRRVRRPLVAVRVGGAITPTGPRRTRLAASPTDQRRTRLAASPTGPRRVGLAATPIGASGGRTTTGDTTAGGTTSPSTSPRRPAFRSALATPRSPIASPIAILVGSSPRRPRPTTMAATRGTGAAPSVPAPTPTAYGPVATVARAPRTGARPPAAPRSASRVRMSPPSRSGAASGPVSASRAVPVGSAGGRRPGSTRPARRSAPPAARAGAHSHLR